MGADLSYSRLFVCSQVCTCRSPRGVPSLPGRGAGGRLPLQSEGLLLGPRAPLSRLTPSRLPTGFDLMDLFRVKDVLGQREDGVQSSYVRMGSFPVVQRTE